MLRTPSASLRTCRTRRSPWLRGIPAIACRTLGVAGMGRGLAAAGTRVVVAARNAEKAAAAVAELGTQSTFIALDVADESSCRAAIDQTEKRFGRLDILVNNAGASIRQPPETYTAAEWHTVLDVNLT